MTTLSFIGDAHLKKRIWTDLKVEGDAYRAFSQAVQESMDADGIVLAGDIFDPPNSESIDEYGKALKDYPGRVVGVQGQHGLANPPWLEVEGLRGENIHRKTVEIGGVTLYGVENQPRHRMKEELERVPEGTDILVLHQLADPCLPYRGTLDPGWIPEYIENVVIGDLHQQTTFEIPGGRAYYTGSLIPCNTREVENTQGYLVYEDGEFSYRTVEVRPFEVFTVSEEDDLEELQEANFFSECMGEHQPVLFIKFDRTIPGIKKAVKKQKDILRDEGILCFYRALDVDSDDEEDAEVEIPDDGLLIPQAREEASSKEQETLLETVLRSPTGESLHSFQQKHYPEVRQ